MNKIIISFFLIFNTCFVYAGNPFTYFLLGGVALANGAYLSDKSQELNKKSDEYQARAVTAQAEAADAARKCGEYEALMEIAQLFNDTYLLAAATDKALAYWDMSVSYQHQTELYYEEAQSKDKRSTKYDYGANTSFVIGGLFLFKGIWDLVKAEQPLYVETPRKEPASSWSMEARLLPGKSEITISRKF